MEEQIRDPRNMDWYILFYLHECLQPREEVSLVFFWLALLTIYKALLNIDYFVKERIFINSFLGFKLGEIRNRT